jgi:hypothetical protein
MSFSNLSTNSPRMSKVAGDATNITTGDTTKTVRLPSSSDYFLKISAGTCYENLTQIPINNEECPILINNKYFTGYILVRINGFDGIMTAYYSI